MDLANRVVIALGERDGIPGQAIAAIATAAGARRVVDFTTCFV